MSSPAQCFLSIKKKITWTDIWDIGVDTGKEDKQSWEDHKECKTDFSISTISCWELPKSSFYKMKLILINLPRKLAGYNSMLNPWCAGYSHVFQYGTSFPTQKLCFGELWRFSVFLWKHQVLSSHFELLHSPNHIQEGPDMFLLHQTC